MSVRCCNRSSFCTALMLWLLSGAAMAQVEIDEGWLRAVPPVSSSTAGYMTLHNRGEQAVVLTGFETDIAEAGEIHTWVDGDEGTRRMQRLTEVEIPAGGKVEFRSGGRHLMLFRLTGELEPGDTHELCFGFRDVESPVCADFAVRRGQ